NRAHSPTTSGSKAIPRHTRIVGQASIRASPNPHLQRAPATDSPRPAGPTSRVGPAKWRESHVRFLRSATHETALGCDTFCRFQRAVGLPSKNGVTDENSSFVT